MNDAPKELENKVLQAIEIARNTGKIRKGTNETTKSLESGKAALVVIAKDVDPPEVVMHLPALCSEKKVPYVYLTSKLDIGRAAGIDVGSAAICIEEAGEGKENLKEIIGNIEKLAK